MKVKRGKVERKVPLAKVTVVALEGLIRAARGAKARSAQSVALAVKAVKEALRKAKLPTVAVSLRGGALWLGAVEIEVIASVAKALAGVKVRE